MTRDKTSAFLNRYEHIFWELTKYILSRQAVFDDTTHTFFLSQSVAGQRTGKYALLQDVSDAMPYRLNSPLAQYVVNSALSLSLDTRAEIIFDQHALPMNASLPDYLLGHSGYLQLSLLSVSAFSDEQYMLFNGITDGGRILSQEDCEKLFLNGGEERTGVDIDEQTRHRLQSDVVQHTTAKLKEIDSRNLLFFRQEENRIYQWEHDVVDGIETEISTVKRSIQQAEREARLAQSVEEKLKLERQVDELKRKKRRLRNELEDREDEVAEQRKAMLHELEQRLIRQTESQNMFLVRWSVKNE